jgi:hypothetical protein
MITLRGQEWAKQHKLQLNIYKTKHIIINQTTARIYSTFYPFLFNNKDSFLSVDGTKRIESVTDQQQDQ